MGHVSQGATSISPLFMPVRWITAKRQHMFTQCTRSVPNRVHSVFVKKDTCVIVKFQNPYL